MVEWRVEGRSLSTQAEGVFDQRWSVGTLGGSREMFYPPDTADMADSPHLPAPQHLNTEPITHGPSSMCSLYFL